MIMKEIMPFDFIIKLIDVNDLFFYHSLKKWRS